MHGGERGSTVRPYCMVACLFMALKSGPGWLKGFGLCCFQIPMTIHRHLCQKLCSETCIDMYMKDEPSRAPSGSRGRGTPNTFSSGGRWKVVRLICTVRSMSTFAGRQTLSESRQGAPAYLPWIHVLQEHVGIHGRPVGSIP